MSNPINSIPDQTQNRENWVRRKFERYTDSTEQECADSFDGSELCDFMRKAWEEGFEQGRLAERERICLWLNPGPNPPFAPETARTIREIVELLRKG